jgi:hypothetical protein
MTVPGHKINPRAISIKVSEKNFLEGFLENIRRNREKSLERGRSGEEISRETKRRKISKENIGRNHWLER